MVLFWLSASHWSCEWCWAGIQWVYHSCSTDSSCLMTAAWWQRWREMWGRIRTVKVICCKIKTIIWKCPIKPRELQSWVMLLCGCMAAKLFLDMNFQENFQTFSGIYLPHMNSRRFSSQTFTQTQKSPEHSGEGWHSIQEAGRNLSIYLWRSCVFVKGDIQGKCHFCSAYICSLGYLACLPGPTNFYEKNNSRCLLWFLDVRHDALECRWMGLRPKSTSQTNHAYVGSLATKSC